MIAGFDARDEGEYVGPDTLARPELLALFPPRPGTATAGAASAADAPRDASTPNIMTSGREYGGDRERLALRPEDEDIIRAVAAANPRTVVCLVAAGAVLTEAWRHEVPAILMMGYAGMEGGRALADVLTGTQNPSGRLPFSVPTSADHLPFFDRAATAITCDRWHGQRLLDKLGVAPAFPHGFGLAYTTFSIDHVAAGVPGASGVRLAVTVTNTGDRDGHHVIQVYGRCRQGTCGDELLLVGFAGADVPAGSSVVADVAVSFTPLARWSPALHARVVPAAADIVLEVGSYAHDPSAVVVSFETFPMAH